MTKHINTRVLLVLVSLFLLSLISLTQAQGDTTKPARPAGDWLLEEVLEFNANALGGDNAWASVHNIRVQLDIREPSYELTGIYVASRDGSMRIDVYAGEDHVFSEGLHLGKSWQWSPDKGVSTTTEAAAVALQNSVNAPGRFYTLQQANQRGDEMQLVPAAVPGLWQIRATFANGSSVDYLVDQTTGFTVRELSQRAFHPDIDPTEVEIETLHSEPIRIDGVLRYQHSEQRVPKTGEWLGTTVARSIEHNIEIPPGYFSASSQ